jgi:hypothetical protein
MHALLTPTPTHYTPTPAFVEDLSSDLEPHGLADERDGPLVYAAPLLYLNFLRVPLLFIFCLAYLHWDIQTTCRYAFHLIAFL